MCAANVLAATQTAFWLDLAKLCERGSIDENAQEKSFAKDRKNGNFADFWLLAQATFLALLNPEKGA
jgi:UDP-glucose 6-dehydrogenase